MKISEYMQCLQEIIDKSGDRELSEIHEDDIPDEFLMRFVREAQLTLIPPWTNPSGEWSIVVGIFDIDLDDDELNGKIGVTTVAELIEQAIPPMMFVDAEEMQALSTLLFSLAERVKPQ